MGGGRGERWGGGDREVTGRQGGREGAVGREGVVHHPPATPLHAARGHAWRPITRSRRSKGASGPEPGKKAWQGSGRAWVGVVRAACAPRAPRPPVHTAFRLQIAHLHM